MVRALNYASFRGIKFDLENHEDVYKRKIIRHPVALANEEKYEDLGPDEDGFIVRGFLAGDTASFSADLLRRKLKDNKPGRLIHPYYGIINVRCRECTISENFRFSGRIGLKFNFIEVKGEDDFISSVADAVGGVQDFIADNITGPFSEALDLIRMPGYIVASAADIVGNIDKFIRSENGIGVLLDEFSGVAGSVESIQNSMRSLTDAPVKYAEAVIESVLNFSRVEPAFALAEALLRPPDVSAIDKPLRTLDQVEKSNTRAFSDLVSFAAIARAIKEIKSKGQGARHSIPESLMLCKKLTEDPTSDRLFTEAYRLRVVIESLADSSARKIKIVEPVPSLVAAYEILGDINRETELLVTNIIQNPLEVSGEIYAD